jgi:hypothetical protein
MPAASPWQALPKMNSPARRCRPPGKALPLCGEGGKEGLPPCGEGSLQGKAFPPSREEVAYKRILETDPEGRDLRECGRRILKGSLLSPPGSTHGGHTAKVHCTGLAGGIITTRGTVIVDKTSWSSPIGAALQAE